MRCSSLIVLISVPFAATTVSLASTDPQPPQSDSKLRASLALVHNSADIRVVESEVSIPENTIASDLDIETSDELNISANALTASLGYRILPFAEISGQFGLLESEVNTRFRVTGDVEGPLGLFSGPIDFETDGGREATGYLYGLGIAAGFPVAEINSRRLALYTNYRASWSSLDSGNVTSTATRTSLGLAYPIEQQSRHETTYTVGATYHWLQREVEQTTTVSGTDFGLSLVQEYQEPWSLDAGVKFPAGSNLSLGVGLSHSMSGATSGLVTLTVHP